MSDVFTNMNINFLFVLFLPVIITDKVNKTQLESFRKDFIFQMVQGIPFRLPSLGLQNKPAVEDATVMFYLYNKQYPRDSIEINEDLKKVNAKLPVKLLVHGWTEHYYVEWCKHLTAAYLKKGQYNVIVLDWSSKGDADYISASLAVPIVASTVGDYIVTKLHGERKVSLDRIHLISHSLGCHVAGLVGQRVYNLTGKKLGRITGLDAAAPYFDFITLNKNDRLSADDANFVDMIHTDGGWLGFKTSLGTADFYPNGGTAIQPGCSLLKADVKYEDLFCSHASSHKFFIMSISKPGMKAVSCTSGDKYNQGGCMNNTEVAFGEDAPNNLSGNYYMRTSNDV